MNKKKLTFAGAVALAAVVAAVVYYATGGFQAAGGPRDEFNAMAAGMAAGNKGVVSGLVSKQFKDAGLDYDAVVEELSVKHPGYMATIDGTVVNGAVAEVSYTRKEIVDKKPATTKVDKETWVKEGDGKWRLGKFSPADATRIPGVIKSRKDADAKLKAERAAAEAAKTAEKNAPYSYVGKRDPFASLIVEGLAEEGVGADEASKCDSGRKREFLETFDLSNFKFSGVVFSEQYYALIEGQNGHGYTVRRGMHLGRRCGKISNITPERLVVEERHLDLRGGYEVREVELKLREKVE